MLPKDIEIIIYKYHHYDLFKKVLVELIFKNMDFKLVDGYGNTVCMNNIGPYSFEVKLY